VQIAISVTDNDKDAPPWDLRSDLDGSATVLDFKTFMQRAQWQIAEEVLEEEQAKGFDKKPRVRTDNVFGKEPRDVKFQGKIEYFSRQNIGEALIDAYQMLVKRSPAVTGQYVSSHYVYLNGKKIAESQTDLAIWLKSHEASLKGNDLIRIVNVTPYAARIEVRGSRRGTRGKNKGKNYKQVVKSSVGSGAYYLAARAINTKYKAQGRVSFGFLPNGFGGVLVKPTGRFRTSYIPDAARAKRHTSGRFKKRFNGPYVYPSITFRIEQEGIR